jgi:hypothetical protein
MVAKCRRTHLPLTPPPHPPPTHPPMNPSTHPTTPTHPPTHPPTRYALCSTSYEQTAWQQLVGATCMGLTSCYCWDEPDAFLSPGPPSRLTWVAVAYVSSTAPLACTSCLLAITKVTLGCMASAALLVCTSLFACAHVRGSRMWPAMRFTADRPTD